MEKNKIALRPAVNGIFINERREVLLTRRSPQISQPGKWCLPGGHIEAGETWIQAMRREIEEEIHVTVQSEELIGLYSDPSLNLTLEPIAPDLWGQFVVATFLVKSFSGEVSVSDEVDEVGWFELNHLPREIIRSHPVRIQDALNFQGEVFVR